MTAPPQKCLFHVPDPGARGPRPRTDNWLALERWARLILIDCLCHHCSPLVSVVWDQDCNLHIPFPTTDDPVEEEQNWIEVERWAARLRVCGCHEIIPE